MDCKEDRIIKEYHLLNPLWIFIFPNDGNGEVIEYYSLPPFQCFITAMKKINEGYKIIVTVGRNAKMLFNINQNSKTPITYKLAMEYAIDITDNLIDI